MSMSFDACVTFLPTADLESTARFYETVLDLSLALDQKTCRIYKIAKGGYLGFCLKEKTPEQHGVILTLVTEDVDRWYAALTEKNIPIETPPVFNPDYRIYKMFLRDPNGYLVEIQRFEDPRWNTAA